MINCKLADLNIQIESKHDYLDLKLKEYYSDFEKPDLNIKISQNDIEREKIIDKKGAKFVSEAALELTVGLRKIAEALPKYDAVLLHACAFRLMNKGIAFGATSGTGKTTHLLLWKKLLGADVVIINGDKPFVRFVDDNLYVYGTPWCGKEGLSNNIKYPLTDICRITRSETNNTKRISKDEGISLLVNQIYMPYDAEQRIKTLKLINKIAGKVNFWEISCNKEISAAETSFNAIFGMRNIDKPTATV